MFSAILFDVHCPGFRRRIDDSDRIEIQVSIVDSAHWWPRPGWLAMNYLQSINGQVILALDLLAVPLT